MWWGSQWGSPPGSSWTPPPVWPCGSQVWSPAGEVGWGGYSQLVMDSASRGCRQPTPCCPWQASQVAPSVRSSSLKPRASSLPTVPCCCCCCHSFCLPYPRACLHRQTPAKGTEPAKYSQDCRTPCITQPRPWSGPPCPQQGGAEHPTPFRSVFKSACVPVLIAKVQRGDGHRHFLPRQVNILYRFLL